MKKSKILKAIIAVFMIIISSFSFVNPVKAANIGETKELERGEKGYYCVQKWNGSSWIYLTYNQTFYTDTDGQKYIAYCLSPGLPGVGYVSGEKENYGVKITKLLDEDSVWRILKNGYPNKSIAELGVETADDAYFATMQAINAILRGYTLEQAQELYSPGKFAINGENYEDVQRRGTKTLDAMFKLIDIGLNGTETRNQFLNISIKQQSNELKKENDKFYSQTFSVQSSSEISEYSIEKIENLPNGAYIADENGNAKETFNGTEKFKVMIPTDNIKNDFNGRITIKAKQKNYPVYFGESTVEGFQNYALCNNSYADILASCEVLVKTNKSKLNIIKVDKESNQPIQGVKFQIKLSDGTVKDYTTDKDGIITLAEQKPGAITVKEIEAAEKYKLNSEEINIELKYNETKELRLENELKKGNIKILKVDKDDNEIKLSNVEFELRDENNHMVKNGVTDENGELLFEDLLVGSYKIIEVATNKEYELFDEEIIVEVEDAETTELKIENEKIEIPEEPVIPEEPETPEEPEIPEIPEEKEEPEIPEEVTEVTKPQEPKTEIKKELPKTGSNSGVHVIVVILIIINLYNLFMMIREIIKEYKEKAYKEK